MPLLENGQTFPHLEIPAVGGGTISLPGDLTGSYGVVLFYRGSWCPYCRAQLTSFGRAIGSVRDLGIKVTALSVDDEETSAALVAEHDLPFPVGHSADADEIAAVTGAFVNDEPRYLQSTGFVLSPDGLVLNSVYSSGAIGRLVVGDVIGFVRYLASHS
jgi:peroxiredoxin